MHRQRFFFNLGAIAAAMLLIVSSVAFGPEAVMGVGLGTGVTWAVVSLWFTALAVHDRHLEGHMHVDFLRRSVGLWTLLAAVMTTIAVWEAVQAAVFPADPAKWLTLANGIAVAIVGCAGLIAHELCTERVVHFLQVVERPDASHGRTHGPA